MIGWVTSQLLAWLEDPPVEVLITIIAPFAAYLPAEELHVSGVIATVVAGLIVGWRSPRVMASATRVLGTATWGMVIFVVNGLAFLLIGLQLPTVRQDVAGIPGDVLAGMALAICATVIVLRLVWVFPATYLPRMLSASLRRRDPAPPPSVPLILGWGGMRGAVTLAAALALPLETPAGDPLPGRGLVIFLAFTVILVTLIGQGLTLPALIRALGVIDDGSLEHEIVHARMVAAEAALVRIESLRAEAPGHLPMLDRLARPVHRSPGAPRARRGRDRRRRRSREDRRIGARGRGGGCDTRGDRGARARRDPARRHQRRAHCGRRASGTATRSATPRCGPSSATSISTSCGTRPRRSGTAPPPRCGLAAGSPPTATGRSRTG